MATYKDLEDSILRDIGQLPDPTIQAILKRRMGLGTGKAQTQKEVGQELGLTQEEVAQKEREGLEQLKGIVSASPEAEQFRNSEIGQRLIENLRRARCHA